jgi:hypothetical protein
MIWEPYDPGWLVNLAKEQLPEESWLPDAIAKCTQCLRESEAYIYFVDAENPNKPGSDWQYSTCLELTSPTEGWLVLDILKERRVGGIEFVDKIQL